MIRSLWQGPEEDGVEVSISQLCRWFEVPRRAVYYRDSHKAPVIQDRFNEPIKQKIDANPSFGYRTVPGLLWFNKNTVQRIFQLKGWQVLLRPAGFRPKVQVRPSVAAIPNERWATDLRRIWTD